MDKENEKHHTPPIGYGTYVLVWLSLLIFTGLTVGAAGLELRKLAVFIALAIATVKSVLVIAYFMNLKYEDRIFKIMISFTFVILGIILTLTYSDTLTREFIFK